MALIYTSRSLMQGIALAGLTLAGLLTIIFTATPKTMTNSSLGVNVAHAQCSPESCSGGTDGCSCCESCGCSGCSCGCAGSGCGCDQG